MPLSVFRRIARPRLIHYAVGTLEEAAVVGSITAVGAGLYSIGIPKDSVIKYETALKAKKFVVIAHGTASEVKRAGEIMGGRIATAAH